MSAEGHDDHNRETEEAYRDYAVFDQHYERIGKVADLFVDENGNPEYIGIKLGLLGTRSILIPMGIVRVNDRRKLVEIGEPRARIEDAPSFADDEEITSENENRIRVYFGLERAEEHHAPGTAGEVGPEEALEQPGVDTEYGERAEPHETPVEGALPGLSPATEGASATEEGRPPGAPERESRGPRVYGRAWRGGAPAE